MAKSSTTTLVSIHRIQGITSCSDSSTLFADVQLVSIDRDIYQSHINNQPPTSNLYETCHKWFAAPHLNIHYQTQHHRGTRFSGTFPHPSSFSSSFRVDSNQFLNQSQWTGTFELATWPQFFSSLQIHTDLFLYHYLSTMYISILNSVHINIHVHVCRCFYKKNTILKFFFPCSWIRVISPGPFLTSPLPPLHLAKTKCFLSTTFLFILILQTTINLIHQAISWEKKRYW